MRFTEALQEDHPIRILVVAGDEQYRFQGEGIAVITAHLTADGASAQSLVLCPGQLSGPLAFAAF